MKSLFISAFILMTAALSAQPFERYKQNQTYDHSSLIHEYEKMDSLFPEGKLLQIGKTDVGKPLHLFIINSDEDFDLKKIAEGGKAVVLINNAIHPGEPCGVDASLKLSWQLLLSDHKMLENVVIAIIPMYNVGGGLNRACCSRANQNGPEEAGFRGNARNLDLNRDFIKADAMNTWTFQSIYQALDPDVFVDTHTSNGADYAYTMTLIATQHNKLHPKLGRFQKEVFEPELYKKMQQKDYDISPYVHTIKSVPDSGILEYLETPRYSTGYTSQFHSFGFVTEAHMLKSYAARVEATYHMLMSILEFSAENSDRIQMIRNSARRSSISQTDFPLRYELDKQAYSTFMFSGYAAKYKKSEITGQDRLYYDPEEPYLKQIPFYDTYLPTLKVKAPTFYVVPQVWNEVLNRLEHNGVKMLRFKNDTTIPVEVYYIEDYQTIKRPYEGHYLHYDVSVRKEAQTIQLYQGDVLIPTAQSRKRFIVETLEPQAVDSYFAWNFFDEILQQKEWFSAYVFEDKAVQILEKDPDLKKRFEEKKQSDPDFKENVRAQLFFIYKNSDYYEHSHMRYPVYRIP